MTSSVRLRVFFLFSAGYFVSYVFRGVNLGFAPLITHDLGLSAADLGLLTSFISSASRARRFRPACCSITSAPRRVTAGMLLFAALGIWVFGMAHGLAVMMVGRLLIGVGVSVCLSAAFKALRAVFRRSRACR